MKKGIKNQKRGISLIVLVITIVVMIILASAIILSLRSSGIIGRANEAKTKSDAATKREAAAIKLAEYELGVQMGDIDGGAISANDYVKAELEKDGIDTSDMVVTAGGEIQVGLSEVAVALVEAGAKIGDTVTGYVLSTATTAKTVSTDGSENTCDPEDYVETDPIPASLTRDESITWKYFGINEKGEALIVGSVTSTTPKITLGGKGGYLNGPSTLKTICETMYSSEMGSARSITIEDVTRVLEYTGERGAYWEPENGDYVPTAKAKTINEIAAEIGYDMSNFSDSTPESGKEIGEYISDYYYINKTADASEYNTEMQSIIYPGTSTTNPTLTTTYWLSSPCVVAVFRGSCADFRVRFVRSTSVGASDVFNSYDGSYYDSYAVRPVVSLSSNVQVAYDGTTITLS